MAERCQRTADERLNPNPTAAIFSSPARVRGMPMRCTTSGLSIGQRWPSNDAAATADRPQGRQSTQLQVRLTRMTIQTRQTRSAHSGQRDVDAGLRKSRRSSIGSASVCWRRMKVTASRDRQHRKDGEPAQAVLDDLLQAIDTASTEAIDSRGAQESGTSGGWIAVLGQRIGPAIKSTP